jgi:hypothetical protein
MTIQTRNLLALPLAGRNVPVGTMNGSESVSNNVNNETKIDAARRENKKKLPSCNNEKSGLKLSSKLKHRHRHKHKHSKHPPESVRPNRRGDPALRL